MKKLLNNHLACFDFEEFNKPNIDYFPTYAWEWNAEIKKDTIKEQIDEMYSSGIYSFYVIAMPSDFRPNTMVTELKPSYLSEEYMDLIKFATDYAKLKGMNMWLYDEAAWPSGGAGGLVVKENTKNAKKFLACREVTLEKGEKYIPSDDVISSFNCDNIRVNKGYTPNKQVKIFEYIRKQESTYFTDPSELESAKSFIRITHEKYKKAISNEFGNMISVMFTDEPSTGIPSFPYCIEENFIKKYGYDIRDYLPCILHREPKNKNEQQVLIDYGRICGEILNRDSLKIQQKWCKENNLLFAGHFSNDHIPECCLTEGHTNIVDALRQLDIPGIDVIWRQIFPGQTTPGAPFFPRFASSAAHQNGTNCALSESFSVYGNGLTFDQMRYILNYQAIRGINIFNFMLVSYGRERYLAFTQRPNFSSNNPENDSLPAINEYSARLSYLCSLGKIESEVALYLPMNDFYAGKDECQKASKAFVELGNRLEREGIYFDVIEDYGIENAITNEDSIIIGQAKYKSVYIPENDFMSESIKEKLSPYVKSSDSIINSSVGFNNIRVMKRTLDSGEILYFLYNESEDNTLAKISFPECKNIFELDLQFGEIYDGSYTKDMEITFVSGEIKVFLLTDNKYTVTINNHLSDFSKEQIVKDFCAKPIEKFVLDKNGSHKEKLYSDYKTINLGDFKQYFGEDFSGKVSYVSEFSVDSVSSDILLKIKDISYSARVFVNDSFVGDMIIKPFEIVIPKKLIKQGKNKIEIIVANTAANQFVFSNAESFFEEKETGCYHPTTKNFEKDSIGGGLYGPIVLKYNG